MATNNNPSMKDPERVFLEAAVHAYLSIVSRKHTTVNAEELAQDIPNMSYARLWRLYEMLKDLAHLPAQ